MKKTEITISFGVAVHEFGQSDLEIPIGSPVGVVPQRTMDFACNNASLQRIAGPWATKMYQNIAKMAAWTITHNNKPVSSNAIEFQHCYDHHLPRYIANPRHSMSKHPENAQFRSPRFTKIRLICLICFPKPLNKLEVVYHAYNIQSVTMIYLNTQHLRCGVAPCVHRPGHNRATGVINLN